MEAQTRDVYVCSCRNLRIDHCGKCRLECVFHSKETSGPDGPSAHDRAQIGRRFCQHDASRGESKRWKQKDGEVMNARFRDSSLCPGFSIADWIRCSIPHE